MLLELTGVTDGSSAWELRYSATRKAVVESVDVFDETNAAFITVGIAGHGSPLTAVAALAQGATSFPGASVLWSGAVTLERDEDLVVIITNAVASDVIKAKIKMRGVKE